MWGAFLYNRRFEIGQPERGCGQRVSERLLEGINLCCERDHRVLFESLNMDVGAGEVLQIEGPNGSGKTTLLRVLTGLSEASEGEVHWRGEPIRKVREDYYQHMQYLGHAAGIKQALTAQENLRWYAALAGLECDEQIDETLAKVGLRGYEDVPCYTLSAGQQRRVNLARLYLLPAKLWILDEPFTAIDKSGVKAIEELLIHQAQQGGAVILTTHQDLQHVPGLRKLELK